MFRLLSAAIAFGFAFGLTAATGQTLDMEAQKAPGEYKMAKDPCKNPSDAGREQCAKDAKATEESSRMRCGKLTDQARRECVLEAFVQQHDRMNAGDRIETRAPTAGVQPR
jgi:hypothetical protein